MFTSVFVGITLILALVDGVLWLAAALFRRKRGLASAAKAVGVVVSATGFLAISARWIDAGHPPFATMYETAIVFAFAVLLASTVIGWAGLSPAVTVTGFFAASLILASASLFADSTIKPLVPVLKSNWLVIHVTCYMIGYGGVAIAFVAAVIDLFKRLVKRRDDGSAPETDYSGLGHRIVALSFPLLTIGLVTGAVWARQAWGRYWSWDPKETWALITWVCYLLYLHLPFVSTRFRLSRRGFALLLDVVMVLCFAVLVFTYLGLRYLPSIKSYHLY